MEPSRRAVLTAATALPLAAMSSGCSSRSDSDSVRRPVTPTSSRGTSSAHPAPPALGPIAQKHAVRLGVYAVDTGSRREVRFHEDERFAYASTFKALASGLVLKKSGLAGLETAVAISAADLRPASPVSSRYVGKTMTMREIIDAAVRFSDNTAGNKLLTALGGPAGFGTSLQATLGDHVTRPSRYEVELSDGVPGDERDTSTARQLATDLRALLVDDVLPSPERAFLRDTMWRNTTGDTTIRAGVPKGWTVADKTGTASYGGRNDIAVIWPPDREPVVIAVLSTRDTQGSKGVDAVIAESTREVLRALGLVPAA
ncbi:class A beta-lactamase [Luteipulveratus halotolerans]|uniref:class A beta-lactamase n=1 Tax=Luteipulveratus halotolerans TaxID=1631356 RepID=UPI0018D07722|nr:class A beta-lactamase [Luteipulveratus halotolerans]